MNNQTITPVVAKSITCKNVLSKFFNMYAALQTCPGKLENLTRKKQLRVRSIDPLLE